MKKAAIILAAGKGTRMKSDQPKVVFPIAGKPMVNRVVDTALLVDSEKIVIVVGYKKEVVKSVIEPDERISFAVQEPQNGTGHAIMVCEDQFHGFEGLIYILYGDVPLLTAETLEKMYEKHKKEDAACTVLTAVMEDPLQYGRVLRNEAGGFSRIVEHKDATAEERLVNEINTGIYCFNSEDLWDSVAKLDNNNNQGEYYLTDTLEIIRRSGRHVSIYVLEDLNEASGVNSPEQLKELEKKILDN